MEGVGKQTADRVQCVSIVCYKYTLDDEVTRNRKEEKKKIDVCNKTRNSSLFSYFFAEYRKIELLGTEHNRECDIYLESL